MPNVGATSKINTHPQINLEASKSTKDQAYLSVFTPVEVNINSIDNKKGFEEQKNIILNAITILQKEQNNQANPNSNVSYFGAADVSIDSLEQDIEVINEVKTSIQEILGKNITPAVLDKLHHGISKLEYQLHIFDDKSYYRNFKNETGDEYKGFLVNGKFNGIGKLIKANGDIYNGKFENDKYTGKSLLIMGNGDRYDGIFADNLFYGQGSFVKLSGYKYVGQFLNGAITYGTYSLNGGGGDEYNGSFKDWKYEGNGTLKKPNGNKYEGEFANGKLVKGIFTKDNGDKYDGDFVDEVFVKGTYTRFDNGDIYTGEFENWQLIKGTYTRSDNGDMFTGEFKNWEFYKGILIYSDGEEYEGEFENGEFVIGTYTWLDDEKNIHKLTKLTRDKIIKNAIYTWSQGDKTYTYKGEFKNKKPHGKGTLAYPDGAVYNGGFVDGRRHGYGIYTNADGSRYEGDYRNGQRDGSGTFFDKEGKQTFTGVFKNGEPVLEKKTLQEPYSSEITNE